ncbi:MAG: dihydropteroate synthase [Chloroflexota bacterium]
MGIVNVSPDSFSGDGLADVEAAVCLGKQLVVDGADIVDVGGESTRPGSQPISVGEELRRVIPVVRRLSRELAAPISVDTCKLQVARQAVDVGARIINDIWGLKRTPALADLAAERGIPIILMSNQRDKPAGDIVRAVLSDLRRAIGQAVERGVAPENIIVDPGIGFGKTLEQNLELVHKLDRLKDLGRPILLGTSRKSLIGLVLNLPAEDRLEGTAATVAIGIAGGADIVRVHDVAGMMRVCRMSDAVVRARK